MPSTSETILQALFVTLSVQMPPTAKLLRNATIPERIPTGGLAILRDGDPGEPEVLLSPAQYIYDHRAEVDLIVDAASPDARDATFDALKLAVGTALASNRTLGGRCDYVLAEAAAPVALAIEGGEGMKAATIGVILIYGTDDPLT
jgi:hypothetical protein